MTRRAENEENVAPFLAKCYEMVDDQSSNHIISWTQSNDSFIVTNITDFTRDLLPKYFKHSNFSSFMRQLNIYGFRKADTDRWEFTNERFIRGEKHLLKSIKRRKNIQASTQKNPQPDQPIEDSDKVGSFNLEKEVEILKTDKIALMQELSTLRERQESSQNKLLLLRESLQGMENDQQELLSFIVMVMQSPGLLVQLLQPKEKNRRVTKSGKYTLNKETGSENTVVPDRSIVRYQPMSTDENPPLPSLTDTEKKFGPDFSFNGIEDFFMNFNSPSPPLDESFLWSEHSGSIPLELDLEKLEQFLLSSPTRDGGEEPNVDDDQTLLTEMETETETLLRYTQLQDCSGGVHQPVSVEDLTEKMGCLSPGRKTVETRQHYSSK